MADKSDEEIVKEEAGLESKISDEEVLAHLSLGKEDENKEENSESSEQNNSETNEENSKQTNDEEVIANEDKDDEKDPNSLNPNKAEEFEEFEVQKKQPKIFRLLIAIASTLFLVLIIGLILYFIGFFDSEAPKKEEIAKIKENKPVPEIVFNEKEIDKKELNKKLTMLTKKEIMNKEELEAEEKKIEEERKRKEEEQKKALEAKKKEEEQKLANQLAKIEKEKKELQEQQKLIKQQQEEFLQLQEKAKKEIENRINNINNNEVQANNMKNEESNLPLEKQETNVSPEEINKMIQEVDTKQMANNSFLSFINVATIKGVLYKSFLDDVQKYDKNISLCRDLKNRIEIYVGPYDSTKERQKVYNLLLENGFKEAYLVDLTKEEYEKRCKY
jgi:hypothetical protein